MAEKIVDEMPKLLFDPNDYFGGPVERKNPYVGEALDNTTKEAREKR